MKKIVLVLVMIFLFTACKRTDKTLNGITSAILIKKDLKVESLLVEEVDSIDLEKLEKFIQNEILSFDNTKEDVKLKKISYEAPYLKLNFEYSSFDKMLEYARYSNDDSIAFTSLKIYDRESFLNSEYYIADEKGAKKFLVLEGFGTVYFEDKLLNATCLGMANLQVNEDNIVLIDNTDENITAKEVKTIIAVK